MKKKIIFTMAAVAALVTVVSIACKKNQAFAPRETFAGIQAEDPCGCKDENGNYKGTVTLPNVISADRTLTCDTLWILDGKTYVTNGATLFIDQGARIEGVKKLTASAASALIITRGSNIEAEGVNECPIVFTSHEVNPQPGDWGGIVILGAAPLNRADTTIEGIGEPSLPAGVDISYGGGGACVGSCSDNSGTLRFVRIEYAGAVITEGNELNGLTLGGVGNGTTLSFIQTAYGADDGFEFFGGCVNGDHLVSFGNNDDDFDFDFGYVGTIQFAVSSKVPDLTYSPNPNGIESDNNPATVAFPTCKRTNAVLTNLTVIGSDNNCTNAKALLDGARFRTNSSYTFRNSIVIDWPNGINLQSLPTQADSARIAYNILRATIDPAIATSPTNPLSLAGMPNDIANGCSGPDYDNAYVKMVAPYAATPDYTLTATSPALSGANFTGLTGVTVTTYRGAFPLSSGSANWTKDWCRWNY